MIKSKIKSIPNSQIKCQNKLGDKMTAYVGLYYNKLHYNFRLEIYRLL